MRCDSKKQEGMWDIKIYSHISNYFNEKRKDFALRARRSVKNRDSWQKIFEI